jgi:flagellar protein FlbD
MIRVTRLDGQELVLNSDLILVIEKTPDTMITAVTGERILLREPVDEVIERIVAYRRRLYRDPDQPRVEPALGADRPAGLIATALPPKEED